MADKDLVLSKLESLTNCIKRIEGKKPEKVEALISDFDLQDILSVNIERAVQLMVDTGLHILSRDFGIRPGDMASVFDELEKADILGEKLAGSLKKSVGFRNIAVHEYHVIDWNIVYSIADKNVTDFRAFIKVILEYIEKQEVNHGRTQTDTDES